MSDDRDVVVEALAREWDAEPDEIWEPWTPKPGDRVRVLPRPECLYCVGSEVEDGLTGVFLRRETFADPDEWSREARAHAYWVEFDEPFAARGNSPFAACELIPVSQEPRERVGLEGA